MFHAEVRLIARNLADIEPLGEAAFAFASALRGNGQIVGDSSGSQLGRRLRLLCMVPEKCALERRFDDQEVADTFERLAALCSGRVSFIVTGGVLHTPPPCLCHRRAHLHLLTNLLDDSSPLACGQCRRPVPFYRLQQLDRPLRERILSWKRSYQSCDELWMACRVGEDWSYRQLAQLNSRLSDEGRAICTEIEKTLGLPLFYYLMRYRRRSPATERNRKCPACGGAWLLPVPEGCFDFRCEPCRLLSNLAP
jgi:predicted  nucleic acid-binding Zn ribbon protein